MIEGRIDILNLVSNNGIGVEIGTYDGEFARLILEKWSGKLYMVDPWEKTDSFDNFDVQNNYEHLFNTLKNTENFKGRSFPLKMFSEDAISLFNDESLDFVYIDGNHQYEYVKKDIEMWFPKVKYGGVFSGHDYMNLDWHNDTSWLPNGKDKHIYGTDLEGKWLYYGIFGVNSAVDEFINEKKYTLGLTSDSFVKSWYIIK